MKSIELYARILKLNQNIFRTDDIAKWLRITNMHASKILSRLEESDHILHISRGLWAIKETTTIWDLSKVITNPLPNYVSLQSALYHHGIISQVPEILYLVSPARSQVIHTPLGTISIHHIHPAFFYGYRKNRDGLFIATQEKALIDFLYFYPAKSCLFRALPEIELPESFSISKARRFISRINSIRRRSMVSNLFENLIRNSGLQITYQHSKNTGSKE